MKAKKVNEDFMDDLIGGDQATKTISSWNRMSRDLPEKEYIVNITEPFEITFKQETDYYKFINILKKYEISYSESEKEI